jgi:hypothetical protein
MQVTSFPVWPSSKSGSTENYSFPPRNDTAQLRGPARGAIPAGAVTYGVTVADSWISIWCSFGLTPIAEQPNSPAGAAGETLDPEKSVMRPRAGATHGSAKYS